MQSDKAGSDDDVEDHEARAACEAMMHGSPEHFYTSDIPMGFDVYFSPRTYVRHLLPLSEPAPGGIRCARGRAASEECRPGGTGIQPICKQRQGAAKR